MTPASVHLVAQLIRHQRAMMTSIEKWASVQPPSQTSTELASVVRVFREVLDSYESQLLKASVIETV